MARKNSLGLLILTSVTTFFLFILMVMSISAWNAAQAASSTQPSNCQWIAGYIAVFMIIFFCISGIFLILLAYRYYKGNKVGVQFITKDTTT